MPNYCSNEVVIEAAPKVLDALLALSPEGLDFEIIDPMPEVLSRIILSGTKQIEAGGERIAVPDEVLEGLRETYGVDNWHSWGVSRWGTKWPVRGEDATWERLAPDRLRARFDTAWSPPEGFVEILSKVVKTGTIKLAFCEYGAGFAGTSTFVNGTRTETTHFDPNDYIDFTEHPETDTVDYEYSEPLASFLSDHGLHLGG